MTKQEKLQTVELLKEAAKLLDSIATKNIEATHNKLWRWPLIDELHGTAIAMEDEANG